MDQPLWRPSADRIKAANLTRFRMQVAERWGVPVDDFAGLHRFSVAAPEKFWLSLWDFAGVIAATRGEVVLQDGHAMPGAAANVPDATVPARALRDHPRPVQ